MQVGWLLDRDADLHVNEDQPLFEAAYHGAVRGGPWLGWKQRDLSRCGQQTGLRGRNSAAYHDTYREGLTESRAECEAVEHAVAYFFIFPFPANHCSIPRCPRCVHVGHEGVVKLLVHRGAEVSPSSLFRLYIHCQYIVFSYCTRYAQVRSGSDRSLIAAAFKGRVGVARVLLRNGEI